MMVTCLSLVYGLPLAGEALGFGDLFRGHFLGDCVTRLRILVVILTRHLSSGKV